MWRGVVITATSTRSNNQNINNARLTGRQQHSSKFSTVKQLRPMFQETAFVTAGILTIVLMWIHYIFAGCNRSCDNFIDTYL